MSGAARDIKKNLAVSIPYFSETTSGKITFPFLEKAILGTERVLKQLRLGNLDRIFLASNCPSEVKKDLTINAGLVGATLIDLELSNEELGVLCKKNFFITVLGIVKE